MKVEDVASAGIRHSCFPNCGVNARNELFAITPIVPGTPLTVDYSTLFKGNSFIFNCQCGYNGCRKVILGFDQLPVFFQEKYICLGAVPWELAKVAGSQSNTNGFEIAFR